MQKTKVPPSVRPVSNRWMPELWASPKPFGEVLVADVAAGTIEVHWPEGTVLVNPQARSPLAKIPAYKEFWAAVEPAEKAARAEPALNL